MLQERHKIMSLVQASRNGEHEMHKNPDLIREQNGDVTGRTDVIKLF